MTTRMRPRRWLLLTLVAVIGYLGVAASPADAHEPSATLVTVSREDDTIFLDVRAPLDRYDFAYGTDLADDPVEAVADARVQLTEQLEDTVTLVSTSGGTWTTSVTEVATAEVNGVPNLAVRLVATPDSGVVTGAVQLDWRFITDTVYSHKVYVVLAENADTVLAAETVDPNTILGLITTQDPVRVIDDAVPSATSTFTSLFRIGFEHFREGPDHLLFLCLVALGAARRRHSWVTTTGRLALLTLAFTIGHSISLAATTLGLISIPGPLIETGIAITILVTAIHAVRPTLSARAEPMVTAAFGLIHGCGFAGTLADVSIQGMDAAVPLFGFNLGLEAAQVLGLLLVVVPLLILARSTLATAILAGIVGLVALGWIAERGLGLTDPFTDIVAVLAGSPERLALTLATGAGLLLVAQHTRRRDEDATSDHAIQKVEVETPVKA